MTSTNTALQYIPDENKASLASSMGGASIKQAQRVAFDKQYQLRTREVVDLIDTCLRFRREQSHSAELVFTDNEPTAQGRLRLTCLYKPFDISVFDGQARLITGDICTYLPSRAAVGGRHWLVLSSDIYQQLEERLNPKELDNDLVRLSPSIITFNTYAGTVDGKKYTDIFVATEVL